MSPSSRGLRASAVVAATAVLLATGCGAGPAAGPGKSAVAKGVAVVAPVADEPPRADWKAAAYAEVGCSSRPDWVAGGLPAGAWDAATVQVREADVTGDGAAEVLVRGVCPAPTSTLPEHVVVFDVSGPAPDVLGVLGGDLFLPRATVTVDGPTVTLSGPTIAGEDPTCCPGHRGVVTYAWDGVRFVVAAVSEVPATSP